MSMSMSMRDEALRAAHAEVKAELARTDTKASMLVAFVGAVLAGVWSVATGADLPLASLIVGGAGVVGLLASVAVLLGSVRPNLGGTAGFPRWATLTAEEVHAELGEDRRAEHIATLSRIAVAKFGRLRRAIDLIGLSGGLLVVAAVIALIGRAT